MHHAYNFQRDIRSLTAARRRIHGQLVAGIVVGRLSTAACVAKVHELRLPALTASGDVCNAEGMKLSVTTELDLDGPHDSGYVTWLDVRIGDAGRTYGTARIALVHVGEIADAAGEVWPALHGTRLEPIHDVYFAQGWYKDDYADGAGIDLLYIDHITLDEGQQNKNIDLALVRRLCDTLGSGCQLAVVAYEDAERAARWARLGFAISTAGRPAGLMHMKLGYRHARVIDATGSGDYEVVASTDTYEPARSAAN